MYTSVVTVFGLLALVSAAPKCTSGTKDVKINFDDLKAYKPGTLNGYHGLHWAGAGVEFNPVAYKFNVNESHPFTGSSRPNVIRSSSRSITISSSALNDFALNGFDLACWTYASDINLLPSKCSFIVSTGDANDKGETTLFNYEEDDFEKPKFVHFDLPGGSSSQFEILLVGQPLGKHPIPERLVFTLDNVDIAKKCH